jgi:hypothetical protein
MGRIVQLESELEILRRSGLSIVSPSIAGMRETLGNNLSTTN